MKIKVILNGGLGNQMFQYAFTRALSIHYNCELIVDKSNIQGERKYLLEEYFDIKSEIDNEENYIPIIEKNPYLEGEENKYYDFLDREKNYVFIGYWQNENFFKRYEEQIRQDFNLKKKKENHKGVILQVRRGDFVNNKNHEYCNLEWYKKALKIMNEKNVFITSDDITWCKDNFENLNYNFSYLIGNEKEILEYMVNFKNFIISNSSFGWWGSWLSKSDNVICPKIWYPADLRWNTSKDNWIKI
jgi:hypothetical protein